MIMHRTAPARPVITEVSVWNPRNGRLIPGAVGAASGKQQKVGGH
jgi:hypothetical protein